MEVHIVHPYGYCKGVQQAIVLAERARIENPGIPVYLLGMLVHNEETIEALAKKDIRFLDEKDGPFEELIQRIPNGSVIVFSAHGHDAKLDDIAKAKKLKIYDATCYFVRENLEEALANVQERPIIYIGVKGHLESEAFRANCPKAYFYDVKNGPDGWDVSSLKNPHLISQTTLSDSELQEAHAFLKKAFPSLSIGKERCQATSLRQSALRNLPKDIDLVVILGSKRSNNSRKLYEIAIEEGKDAILALGLAELKEFDLHSKKKVALASGASTSPATFQDCLKYLQSL